MRTILQLEPADSLLVVTNRSRLSDFPAQFEIGWCSGRALRKEWKLLPEDAQVPIDYQLPDGMRADSYGLIGLPTGKAVIVKFMSGGAGMLDLVPAKAAPVKIAPSRRAAPLINLRQALNAAAAVILRRLTITSKPHVEIIQQAQ